MFIHSVYFWLKPGTTPSEEEAFVQGAKSLTAIASVRHGWVGKPAATDRPIIERGYSYALVVTFDDAAGHDFYQVDKVHDLFRDNCHHYWNKVTIFDFET
jgi:hypothetical protein